MRRARRDDAAPYQSAVVDLLADDGRRGSRPSSRPVGGLARAGAVLLFLIGGGLLAYLPVMARAATVMDTATVCTTAHVVGDDVACLVPVTGHVAGTWGYGKWRFDPDPPALRDATLRFTGDDGDPDTWAPALREVLGGATVTALYWDDEPVAFETGRGRVETIGFGTTYLAVAAWFAVMCLSFAVGALVTAGRRPLGRLGAALAASGTAGLVCVGIDVLAPRSWAVEGAVWGASVLAAVVLAGRRREPHGR